MAAHDSPAVHSLDGGVSPTQVLPEYPRPQLVRSRWLNLNGAWQFANAVEGETPPVGRTLGSDPGALSHRVGVVGHHAASRSDVVRRTFTIPTELGGRARAVDFGAGRLGSDGHVNAGSPVTSRGYDAFSLDITDQLNGGLTNDRECLRSTNAGQPALG